MRLEEVLGRVHYSEDRERASPFLGKPPQHGCPAPPPDDDVERGAQAASLAGMVWFISISSHISHLIRLCAAPDQPLQAGLATFLHLLRQRGRVLHGKDRRAAGGTAVDVGV